MRSRGIVLSLLSALVLVALGPVGAAPAAVAFTGVTTTHADRMPVATEPWRTLVEARLKVETTFDTWTATVRLGDAIPAGETVELTWTAGRKTVEGCTTIATFVEETGVADEDHSITILRRTFDPEDTIDPSDPTPICFGVSMRAGGIVSDALVGTMGSDEEAAAIIGAEASASEHRAGFPRTTAPHQRLESASFRGDVVSGAYLRSATFAGALPEGSSYTINWMLGRQNPTGCEVLISFAEVDEPLDAGNTVSIERDHAYSDVGSEMSSEFTCFEVVLYIDDMHSDTLVGQVTPLVADVTVDAAPAAEEFVVAAGRSTPVIVTASSRVGARKGLTVSGKGRGVRADRASTGAVVARRERPVVVWVAAERPGRSRLRLTARDARFDVARSTTSWPVKARRIEGQRPRPGRYESADGGVAFRVTRTFVVKGLRVDDIRCEGAASRPTARLRSGVRLPRSGAAARIVRSEGRALGRGFLGAQLLTTSPRRLVGTFTVATERCTGSVRIVAVRKG